MLENIHVLTSRRAYEFRIDELRLSTISMKPVQEQIQQLFHFQTAVMATPMATFGAVPATYPPGMVFDMGTWLSSDEKLIPIRFLHFEQSRIVIDVAGSSMAITAIFERIQQFLSELTAADGSPVIGKVERVLDYSEITAHFPGNLEAMFVTPLRRLLDEFTPFNSESINSANVAIIPAFTVQAGLNSKDVVTAIANFSDPHAFTFSLRAGTRPEDRVYFSGAPLDADTHLKYLTRLETILSSNG